VGEFRSPHSIAHADIPYFARREPTKMSTDGVMTQLFGLFVSELSTAFSAGSNRHDDRQFCCIGSNTVGESISLH